MTRTVDLNADLGEHDTPTNGALLGQVSSANVSCGVHAGDPLLTHRTLTAAHQHGVVVGAHPSYPDRTGFGRTSMKHAMTTEELSAVLRFQLAGFAALTGGEIRYIKPHGALYNDAQVDQDIARTVAYQALLHEAAVMGQPGSVLHQMCAEYRVRYIAEVFADRGYNHDGTLIRRTLPKAVHTNPEAVARRVVQMVTEQTVTSYGFDHTAGTHVEGTYRFPQVDSVCLHGDTPGAYQIATAVRAALTDAGITIASPLAYGPARPRTQEAPRV